MKKMIFALIALVVALPMVAQDYKIVSDEAKADGSRSISCELVNTRSFSDKQVFNVGLSSITINVEGVPSTRRKRTSRRLLM